MGKSNLCENKAAKRYNFVAGMLDGGFRQQRLTTKAVSEKTGVPERTVRNRIEHPEKIRLEDLYRLCDIAGIRILFEFKEIPD